MKSSVIALAATAAGTAYAAELAGAYSQCGGTNWTGPTACASGYYCQSQNPYYYQCTYGSATATGASEATSAASSVATSTLVTKASTSAAAVASSSQTSIPTTKAVIVSTSAVVSTSAAPSSSAVASSSAAPSSSAVATTSAAPSSSAAATTSAAASSSAAKTSSAATSTSTGKVKYAGVNISGFDFGCSTDGTCTVSGVTDPSTNGVDQMKHFVTDDGLNAFRLPVGWQYLVNSELGGTLDSTNLAAYDSLVSSCVDVADLCIISIHNYARWNGNIIGQSSGSVTNAQFTSLWSQLATKYASETKVAFAIMNEPHDLTSVTTWGETVQEAVTAIRKAGATDNLVLLPGNDWTHASSFISDGSAAALKTITNIDGTTDKLIFDVHQYLDSDGSGTSTTCTTNNADAFETLGAWLRTEGRQAMLTETGGSSDSSCITYVCEELQVLMKYSDVFLGWTGWAAGAFATSYALSETPSGSSGSYTDQDIVTQCIAGVFNGKSTTSK